MLTTTCHRDGQIRRVVATILVVTLACTIGCWSFDAERTELVERSPLLVIKDLSNEYTLQAHAARNSPFDFCGKKTLYTREVKLCAEYFLASLRDDKGDGTRGESLGKNGKPPKVKLWGLPKLAAYDRCMLSSSEYKMKACIREITRTMAQISVFTPDMIHLSRSGSVGRYEAERLSAVGVHAIETAQPDSPLEGLNGGIDGKMAEYSSKDFMAKFNDVGMPPKTNGCEAIGIDGCKTAKEGGIKPPESKRALHDFAEIPQETKEWDTNGDGVIDRREFRAALDRLERKSKAEQSKEVGGKAAGEFKDFGVDEYHVDDDHHNKHVR